MKNPFSSRTPAFHFKAIHNTIQRALKSAGLVTRAGPMHNMTDTIRRSLASGRLPGSNKSTPARESVVDVEARVVGSGEETITPVREPVFKGAEAPETFEKRHFSNEQGARSYKLYVPQRSSNVSAAMVVMLHGCTQSADDFAAGTRMNQLAEEHGFLVVYPEQSAQANLSKCWNWFMAQDQARDAGEPAVIAGIVRDVAARHGVDMRRIFVAGLSAGAAMAVILGETYPELFAAVGAHSGLPYASAHDIPSAMAAMKGGRSGRVGLMAGEGAAASRRKAAQAVPIIVFHGDRDHTVQHDNGTEIVRQATEAHRTAVGADGLLTSTQRAIAPGGRSYSRTIHADANGQPQIECWIVHGAGHAWSGGDVGGSYTDHTGPDASAAMVRFFLALPRAGSA